MCMWRNDIQLRWTDLGPAERFALPFISFQHSFGLNEGARAAAAGSTDADIARTVAASASNSLKNMHVWSQFYQKTDTFYDFFALESRDGWHHFWVPDLDVDSCSAPPLALMESKHLFLNLTLALTLALQTRHEQQALQIYLYLNPRGKIPTSPYTPHSINPSRSSPTYAVIISTQSASDFTDQSANY